MPKKHNSPAEPLTKVDLVEILDAKFKTQEMWFDDKLGALETRMDGKFSAIDSRFEAIDSKFSAIDSRFNVIDGKFEALEMRIDEKIDTLAQAVQRGFSEMGERLGSLELGQSGLRGDIRRIDIRWSRQQEILDDDREVVRSHGRRLAIVENKVGIVPA